MNKTKTNLTRRKFMAVSSAAIAAPLAAPILKNMTGLVPDAVAAEKKTQKQYDFVDKKECDLVVLGGGGSGLIAAVRAAQLSGKKVIVLEKASITGGGALGASTVRTFGSKWQAKRNLPDTTVAYARAMMDGVYWKLDPELVSNCLVGTGQFFDWICELGGDIEDEFKAGKYVFADIDSEPVGPQMSRQIGSKQGFGMFVTTMMANKGKKYGVEVLTGHPVVDIEVKDGKIAAAIAKTDAGYIRISCKACVMAIGSWINNEAILKKYCPEFAEAKKKMNMGGGTSHNKPAGQESAAGQGSPDGGGQAPGGQGGQGGGAPGAQGAPGVQGGQGAPGGQGGGGMQGGHMNSNYTGDGIALAEKVGAFVDYNSFCIRLMGPVGMTMSTVAGAMVQTSFIITVNKDGKRFVSEPLQHMGIFKGGHVQIDQPDAQTYDIFDMNTIAAALKNQKCIDTGSCPDERYVMGPPDGTKSLLPDTMEKINNDLKTNASGILQADTLEELADKMGVDRKNFLETVKRYNECCEKGADLQCFKKKEYLVPINKAPYFASSESLSTDGAFGGVRVNPEMQAYKADHKNLVDGLYVTGDFATGRHISLGGVKLQVLNDLSWAFSSGFLAGTNVANYLKKLA